MKTLIKENWRIFLSIVAIFVLGIAVLAPSDASAIAISEVSVIGVVEPLPGEVPISTAQSGDPSLYTTTFYAWRKCTTASVSSCTTNMGASETFVEGQMYTAWVTVYATPGNTIHSPVPTTMTINGAPATLSGMSSSPSHIIIVSKVYTAKHTYGFTLNPSSNFTFPAKTEGYKNVDTYEAVVGNTSTTSVTVKASLSGTNASAFILEGCNNITLTVLGVPSKCGITVKPKIGLLAGSYKAIVTISGANLTSKSFTISFTVNSADPGGNGDADNDTDADKEEAPGSDDAKDDNGQTDEVTGSGDAEDVFNWLWILFGGLLLVGIGCGITFFVIRNKQRKTSGITSNEDVKEGVDNEATKE